MFRMVLIVLALSLLPRGAAFGQPAKDFNVDGRRIENAETDPGAWLSYGRTYDEQRYSPLNQVNDKNVAQLGLAWDYPTGSGRGHEATPIVVNGTMFLTLPWSKVVALDAVTGERLWDYDPHVAPEYGRTACCDVVNRGVALWKGKVYFGALDGRLIALDAATGKLVWEKQTTDTDKPYTITGAPRIVDDKVIIGNGGAEYGVRGYISAYDAATGDQVWRFYTVPGNPDAPFENPELEKAAKTWTGEWWKVGGGGGTAWDSMAYDPKLHLLYVGTGNGSPWNRAIRSPGGGDNLYLSSILAIDPDTGSLKWHYQTTPADTWDYTATQHIILADLDINGRQRKVLMQAPKNGFFYVLDRETGELLSAKNYVDVTWASHVDMTTGRPVETDGDYAKEPKLVYPSPSGGHNWHPMAYNPQTKLVYIPTISQPFLYVSQADFKYRKGATWNTGADFAELVRLSKSAPAAPMVGYLKAWDPVGQKVVWQVKYDGPTNGGLLTTAGNLVFQGAGDGRFIAYQADAGRKLWEIATNVGIIAPPISYEAKGEQYVAVLAGWGGVPAITGGGDAAVAAAVTHTNAGHLFAFKLGGKAPMPAIDVKRFIMIPPPPASDATAETIARGERLFSNTCAVCHGLMAIGAGVLSDLRYSSKAVHDNFDKIVLDGVLTKNGMASFADVLSKEDVEAIHSYIIDRAREDRAAQLKATPK
jgi:quinohemoprotein ethanol dehydrogenase